MFDLTGKVALVTGGSRGIGRGIVASLNSVGAGVAINYISNLPSESLPKTKVYQADVSVKTEVEQMVGKIVADFGKIDILVNNAGILSYEPFLELKEETWDKLLSVNLKGQFLVAQAVAKQMVKQGTPGRIINIASIASGQVGVGFPGLVHYCASKGGVIAMTEAMALELGKYQINVNAIAPGAIETDMAKISAMDEQTKKGMLSKIPMGRIGQPVDIGAMAVYLSSEESSYCTGAVFYVDGGWLAG